MDELWANIFDDVLEELMEHFHGPPDSPEQTGPTQNQPTLAVMLQALGYFQF